MKQAAKDIPLLTQQSYWLDMKVKKCLKSSIKQLENCSINLV